MVSSIFFAHQNKSKLIETFESLKLSSHCPPGFKRDIHNRCINKNLYLQYAIPNAPGVGGLKTALPEVREGFSPQQIDLGRYLFFDPLLSADTERLPLADVIYTPKSDATWEIKKEDFEVEAATGKVKFTEKTQLILTEYLAYKDAGSFVILKEITENYMNIALGIHTEPSIIDKPTLLFHMSLEAE
jgi:hypothetical protein